MENNKVSLNDDLVAKPFSSLKELYEGLKHLEPWPEIVKLRECTDYVYSGEEVCKNVESSRQLAKLSRNRKPRTIVCHDMKGGYLEDRFINGSPAFDSYLFYHWSIVDIFIYFSHHLITIPPYGWINAAHNHGVKVLGTIISERNDGEIVWEQILSSIEETKKFADALITLAKYYKFDGWLLNIENKIKKESIQQLLYFVQYLTVGMHTEIGDSEVIWYDSVTVNGELNWQNQLNSSNKDFFENCDGIFLNYNWTDAKLASSRSIAELTGRVQDVYVGLDVWGRGCPGGGGFNSIEALKTIRQHDLSVAIFGQGWTHEYFYGRDFNIIENTYWAQLIPHMYIHVPVFENESLSTSFCRGAGEKYYYNGESDELAPQRFYNLSWQELQTSVPNINLKFTSMDCQKIVNKTNETGAENNNSNGEQKIITVCTYDTIFYTIRVRGNDVNVEKKLQKELINSIYFSTKYPYNGGGSLKIVNAYPESYHRLFLLHLEFDTEMQIIKIIHRKVGDSTIPNENDGIQNKYPTLILRNNQSVQHIDPYENFEMDTKWKESYYRTTMRTISEIGITFPEEGSYYLGKFQVLHLPAIKS